ncbi:MAG TPA: L-glutamate gamma-semialdehyde dehydrogenase, partial [Wenzhouxiangella sp.]
GELNQLLYRGRGLFVCISPWNFPLAIFVGQVAAALVTGNSVIAKPAVQTSLIGTRAVELFHQAGVPTAVLHCVPGGAEVGAALTGECEVDGVAFTGSTETARSIAQSLLNRDAPLATLIAETGGQNAMIVDSSALPEQVIKDVISSAFLSAGQRCSALRVLCVQEDIADGVIEMLKGAMAQLRLGRPDCLSSDVGPIIDAQQLEMLEKHCDGLGQSARLIAQTPLPDDLRPGHWFAPKAFLIDSIDQLGREVFGPVLHVVRFQAKSIDGLIDQINGTGYGLTLGIHSRIDRVQTHIASRAKVGNCYVNRNMTGAVVGVQPFGGEGLSGTGPKAGGPNYLYRFCNERVRTINTAAVGGNASLLALSD